MKRTVAFACIMLCSVTFVAAQDAKVKPHIYAHDFRVRKAGIAEFTKDTTKYGIEFYQDDTSKAIIGLMQNGNIAVRPASALKAEKKATWHSANDLRCRKSEEEKFTATTAKIGVEVFQDSASKQLVYVTEKGTFTLETLPESLLKDKEPTWNYGLVLRVRNNSETSFTETSKRIGLETYIDGNTSGIIYITETGHIACTNKLKQDKPSSKISPPKSLYGLTLPVRKANEAKFEEKVTKYSVEVYLDENANKLIYLCETGSLAVVDFKNEKSAGKGITNLYAMVLKARPAGIVSFENVPSFGVEVYRDENTGNNIYVSNTGSVAVLPASK